ncbi:MAG: ATP-binding cassette domain-containing protein [Hydrogenovibrio sp.]|uniref:ABC-F family ATP-binding cassette domain-containing protein n=1 Tax=Hydrogenovibrio sp. TaxID=2065821 RepID=UPI00287077F4|nr:ATP-binding cassette domain-containing protein [Hydrogenovibrio sp.]MDR9497730.1 ATP-binding cassette domain-containing protein [Hydrogenovibrio sp.]
MLQLTDVSLRVGPEPLIENASLTVHPGQKIGLIGANGSGKSTLFKAISGQHSLDAGEITQPPGWQMGQVEQELPPTDEPMLDFVMRGDALYAEASDLIAEAQSRSDDHALTQAWDRMDQIDGYRVEPQAKQMLMGLGFTTDDLARPVRNFSGGWQVRLKLARALMQRSDLLLLDEPTNHLDIEAVAWLIPWLQGFSGALLVISHDRHFLDEVVEGIAHLQSRRLYYYRGNFAAFERQRHEQLMQQQALHEKQKQQMQHLQGFIDRFRAQATKAKQAQSRIKALERMETVAAVQASNPFRFEFFAPAQLPDPMLTVSELRFAYQASEPPIIDGVDLTLRAGDRIGLVGVNGSGKSTLLKCLVGDLTPQQGKVTEARGLKTAYFAQHQLEALQLDHTPMAHLQQLRHEDGSRVTDQEARNFLGQFGFTGDKALGRVKTFSGGEKARLSLALMVFQKPNLLILDEPTNHLDMETRDALDMALQAFSGALILVTHDQHLLSSLVDQFWWVHHGKVKPFHGGLDAYLQQRLQALKAPAGSVSTEGKNEGKTKAPSQSRKAGRQQAAQKRQAIQKQLAPIKKRLSKLEATLQQCEQALEQLHQDMADPELYQAENSALLQKQLKKEAEWKSKQEKAEEDWLSEQDVFEQTKAELEQAG